MKHAPSLEGGTTCCVSVGIAGPAPNRVPSLHSLHMVTFGYTICCLSPCCHYSISESIEFVNFVNCFRCLEISSCLFVGQLPCFDVSLFSVSLDFCSRMQRYIRWSAVCSSLPHRHVELSISLNRCR